VADGRSEADRARAGRFDALLARSDGLDVDIPVFQLFYQPLSGLVILTGWAVPISRGPKGWIFSRSTDRVVRGMLSDKVVFVRIEKIG
jgi:hypothetical protein